MLMLVIAAIDGAVNSSSSIAQQLGIWVPFLTAGVVAFWALSQSNGYQWGLVGARFLGLVLIATTLAGYWLVHHFARFLFHGF